MRIAGAKAAIAGCLIVFGLLAPAAAQTLLPNGQQQFVDANGVPLSGGRVYFYQPNTTTQKFTYQNFALTVPNTNPVVLNAAGRAIVWGSGLYREVLYDQNGNLIWDQQTYGVPASGAASSGSFGLQGSIASATTTNIGSIASNNVLVTGTNTIASFGSSASTATPVFLVSFANALTLTYNATSMVLPGGKSMSVKGGDVALMQYLGLGNWQMVQFLPAARDPSGGVFGVSVSAADAATVDLGLASGNNVEVTGSGTAITSFGMSASTLRPLFLVTFDGAETLTHNGTSLIIPGAANITTGAGDSALVLYLGSGNWRVVQYTQASQSILQPVLEVASFTSSGSYVVPASVGPATTLELSCVGAGGGAGSNSGGSGGGGGGGGAGGYADVLARGFTAGQTLTVTIGTGGAGSTSSGSSGSNGSATTKFTYNSADFIVCGVGSGGTSGTSSPVSVPGGAGGAATINFSGSGLTNVGTVASITGQTGGTGRYQGSSVGAGGAGGGSPLGAGGVPAYSVNGGTAAGFNGAGYGSGGGGGASGGSGQTTGGNGTGGFAAVRGVY